MASRQRRRHAPAFKAQVALAALKGDQTLAEWAQQHDLHPNQITAWQTPRLARVAQVCDGGPFVASPDIKTRHTKLGELTLEQDFLASALTQAGLLGAQRCSTAATPAPIVRPCQVLDLARATVYYPPKPVSPADLALMHRSDALHRQHPFAGARRRRELLGQEGRRVGPPAGGRPDGEEGHHSPLPPAQHPPPTGRGSPFS
jgi:transposase